MAKGDIVELGHAEIRVETNAERQRLVTGVGNGQRQRGGAAAKGLAHRQRKVERVDELSQAVGRQGQLNGGIVGSLDLPGKQIGQAVDLDGIGRAAEVMYAVIGLAAVGEQNGDAAAGAVGGFKNSCRAARGIPRRFW